VTDHERCYVAAMRILGHRFNSEVELRRKLASKRFERDVIDATIERLRKEKWLDDERFAAAFVRTRQAKKIGRDRIRRELNAAGVAGDISEKAIREHADPEREREDLAAVCAKRIRQLKRRHGDDVLETPEGRKKLAAYLLKQGYDFALIRSVIKELPVVDD
jgi:regulatory protein